MWFPLRYCHEKVRPGRSQSREPAARLTKSSGSAWLGCRDLVIVSAVGCGAHGLLKQIIASETAYGGAISTLQITPQTCDFRLAGGLHRLDFDHQTMMHRSCPNMHRKARHAQCSRGTASTLPCKPSNNSSKIQGCLST